MRVARIITAVAALTSGCDSESTQPDTSSEPLRSVQFCHLMGCFDHVEVRFSEPLTREDAYVLTVTGSTMETCRFFIPKAQRTPACSSGLELRQSSPDAVHGYVYYGKPERLSVVLEGTEAEYRSSFELFDWEERQPNGPNCEPTCVFSSQDVALPSDW